MQDKMLSVREIQENDLASITDYWLGSDPDFLRGMGVDLDKMPDREQWMAMLSGQLNQSYEEKKSYCIIWQADGEPVGHSNVNKIVYGQEAYMHLHLWKAGIRQHGLGTSFVKMSLPYFFNNLKIKRLYCEPYALNPAPNKTLERVGFAFVKEYVTVPGMLNFEQPVNLWELSHERYRKMPDSQ